MYVRYMEDMDQKRTKNSSFSTEKELYAIMDANHRKEDNLMVERVVRNGKFIFPNKWIELNADRAEDATQVVICTDGQNVGVYYTNVECQNLTEQQEKEICELAKQCGVEKCNLFGLVEVELLDQLHFENVGNARLVKLERNKEND